MNTEAIRQAVLRALRSVAPEVDPDTLRPDVSLRDQLDIDSMDLLRFLIALRNEVGVSVPESDYAKLATLDGAVRYLDAALAAKGTDTEPRGAGHA